MIIITPIPALKDNYIWAIINKASGSALVVDPGEAAPVQDFLQREQLALAGILITHHHWDHTNGINELQPAPVYGPKQDNISNLTYPLVDEDTFNIEAVPLDFRVLSIPGHTHGHIAFYNAELNALFCGDTLFAAGCGRAFEGTPATLFQSLQKLSALPGDVRIFCGHEYTQNNLQFASLVEPDNQAIKTRLVEVKKIRSQNQPTLPSSMTLEKQTNPFLRCDQPAVIKSATQYAKQTLSSPVEVFTALRQWKNEF